MKQKLFTLLTLLVLCVTGAWAQTVFGYTLPGLGELSLEAYKTAMASAQTATGGTITLGNTSKLATTTYTANGISYQLDGDPSAENSKYVLVTLSNSNTLQAGDVITVSGHSTKSTSMFGLCNLRNGTNMVKTSTMGKNIFSSCTYTVTSSDCLHGNSSFYITRGDNSTLFFYSITINSVPATIAAAGYSTFCSGSALDLSDLTGVTAYKVEDANVTSTSVTLTPVTEAVQANTPLILAGTGSETYYIPTATTGSDISSTNVLKQGSGSAVSSEAGKTKYVLQGGSFKKIVATAATVPTTKAYLEVNRELSANELTFDFSDVTGIEKVEAKKVENGVFFNLAGQQVAQPTKGLYIVNGKKVIVK